MTTPTAPRVPLPTPWWKTLTADNWFIFSFASLAWLFDCLDQQVFNLSRDAAMETLMKNKAVATEYGGYATSIFLIGWSFGGLVFGALGDRYGRARILSLTVLLYSVSTGLNALSVGFADFCVSLQIIAPRCATRLPHSGLEVRVLL